MTRAGMVLADSATAIAHRHGVHLFLAVEVAVRAVAVVAVRRTTKEWGSCVS
jgi:hypothetical protein